MKILVNDGMTEAGMEMLRQAGHEVFNTTIPQDDLNGGRIAEFNAIVVRSATKVREVMIDAGIPNLKAIVRGGVGVDNIDVAYAESKGVKVMNTPAASSASVAEMALGHMFALSRFIIAANLTMRQTQWNKKQYKGVELAGKTLGILGIGRIGQALAMKAIALGMTVIAYDPYVKSVDLDVELMSKDEVLAKADYLSLHIPVDPAGPVIGADELAKMKDGAYLINCARGGTVDESALLDALNSGKLSGAGVDVFVGEPNPNADLVNHPKVSVTPHIGASTKEAQARIGTEVANLLIGFFK
ncbi:MAG: D-2-hydroxyacid dehydrogenase [Candidatus Electryoneaceae bacterium]|nr:D-2-hydroxyacid dehydrogenase [Candidatus Electryoneaceae bacterium]